MKRGRHEAYATTEPNTVMRCSVDNGLLNFAHYGEPWGKCDKCERLYSAITHRQVTVADIAKTAFPDGEYERLVETGHHLPPDVGDML